MNQNGEPHDGEPNDSSDPLPPHSFESEQAVLSAVLREPQEALAIVKARLPGLDAFYDAKNQDLWECLCEMDTRREPIESLSVQLRLREKDQLYAIGTEYIASLFELPPRAESLPFYLEMLLEKYRLRKVDQLYIEAKNQLREHPGKAHAIFTGYADSIKQLCVISGAKGALPEIKDGCDLLAVKLPRPPELIRGFFHQGTKGSLVGGSKAYKTWAELDMATSVATGTPFWEMDTTKAKVLYANLEIPECFFQERLAEVLRAKDLKLERGMFDHWGLRGFTMDVDKLLNEFTARLNGEGYAMIILDPNYKLLNGKDENKAGDISQMLNGLERIVVETGAGLLIGSHFSKGNQSSKDPLDRVSGSGVFARDPDSIITMTPHTQDKAFVVDMTLRNFPSIDPFCVQWEYPLFHRADLDPSKLKQATGRPKKHSADTLWGVLPSAGLTATEWQVKAEEDEGIPRSTYFDLRKELVAAQRVIHSKVDSKWKPVTKKPQ